MARRQRVYPATSGTKNTTEMPSPKASTEPAENHRVQSEPDTKAPKEQLSIEKPNLKVCPKCGKPGSETTKSVKVKGKLYKYRVYEHYDPAAKSKHRYCYLTKKKNLEAPEK